MPFCEVNGVNLYYELHRSVEAPTEAPVLVLNNGILMNAASSWLPQTAPFSRHALVLQYDCRGQGKSDHPEGPYSMQLHAEDLAGLLESLELPAAHIAGISYGGEVAQAFALAFPHKVRSLILADTVSEVHPDLRLVIESWMDAAQRADGDAFFQATVPWNFSAEFIANHGPLLEKSRQRYQELDYPAVVRLCEAFLEVDFTGRLHEINAPTCLLVGELDKLKGLEYASILKQNLPQTELHVLPGAGHASCWETPAEFNTVVLGFLAKQPRQHP